MESQTTTSKKVENGAFFLSFVSFFLFFFSHNKTTFEIIIKIVVYKSDCETQLKAAWEKKKNKDEYDKRKALNEL